MYQFEVDALRRDPNALAAQIVAEATGEAEPEPVKQPEKNPHAQALGRLGSVKGGRARAEKLSPERGGGKSLGKLPKLGGQKKIK